MNSKISLITGAIFGFVSVALGAFGTHVLKPLLLENGRLETYELASRYLMYHGLALLLTGLIGKEKLPRLIKFSSLCFLIGVFFFSGSLYLVALTNRTSFAIVTPFGGLSLLAGWLLLLVSLIRITAKKAG